MSTTLRGSEWVEQMNRARAELDRANRVHHEAQAAFDAALDAYVETRDAWHRAMKQLDYLEEFRSGEGGVMVRDEPPS